MEYNINYNNNKKYATVSYSSAVSEWAWEAWKVQGITSHVTGCSTKKAKGARTGTERHNGGSHEWKGMAKCNEASATPDLAIATKSAGRNTSSVMDTQRCPFNWAVALKKGFCGQSMRAALWSHLINSHSLIIFLELIFI